MTGQLLIIVVLKEKFRTDESSLSSVEKGNTMKNIAVTKQFIEYSKTLAEDIYGYNQCFNRGNSKSARNRKLKYHIKRCEKLLQNMEK